MTRYSTFEYLEARAEKGDLSLYQLVLGNVADVPADPGDEFEL